jgi:hypothetical protein
MLLRMGIGPRVLGILQTLRPTQADRIALGGYDPERRFRAVAAGAHALFAVRIALGSAPWLDGVADADLLGVTMEGSTTLLWSTSLGARFGVSF